MQRLDCGGSHHGDLGRKASQRLLPYALAINEHTVESSKGQSDLTIHAPYLDPHRPLLIGLQSDVEGRASENR